MGDSKALIACALAAALALGCQAGRALTGHAQRMLRSPGEKLAALPERVAEQYDCERSPRPFFKLERNEVVPERVAAGAAINHRFVYALCAARPTDVVRGALETRIVHEGGTVVRDRDPAYALKPGRWIVDATVEIPEAARAGVYAIEVSFQSRAVRFREERTFAVVGAKGR
ncbi:MAG: hypothetical protein DCC71_25265 [Proteobacteria bacterium]|nr:MAG: hypothetical protein DCC71_25265 [Pseudomonadota bacterium]